MKRIVWLILLILLNLSIISLSRGEKQENMGIGLVAIGKLDKQVLEDLKEDLARIFNKQVSIAKDMPEPDYAFNSKRRQYISSAILERIIQEEDYESYEKVLGVIDYDLYVSGLNFVFGQASPKVAVISITRLREEYYSLPGNPNLFRKRVLTEAVHELGHTYGLSHCQNPNCVMFFSNSLIDTDRKGHQFCLNCRKKIRGIFK